MFLVYPLLFLTVIITTKTQCAAILLDHRIITSSALLFPKYGNLRQGIAGCPVRRVLHPRTGELYCPLSTLPCDKNEWIVQTRDSNGKRKADCIYSPCAHNNTVLWTDGLCHSPEENGLCGKGMRLYVDRYGEAYCDCKPNYYIWPSHSQCYAAYSKGPCESGKHVKLVGSGVPVCQRNLCIWEHLVLGADGKCHELGNPALCVAGKVYSVNPDTGEAECVSIQYLSQLGRDLHGCHAGSKLSILQACND